MEKSFSIPISRRDFMKLAGLTAAGAILEGASEFVTTNVEGTQILLDAIRSNPVERFILISSSETTS